MAEEAKLGGFGVWALLLGALYAGVSVMVVTVFGKVGGVNLQASWAAYLVLSAVLTAASFIASKDWKGFFLLWFGLIALFLVLAFWLSIEVEIWLSPQSVALADLVAVLTGLAFLGGMLGITFAFRKKASKKISHNSERKAITRIAFLAFLILMVPLSYFTLQNQGIKYQQKDVQLLGILQENCAVSEGKVEVNLPPGDYLYIQRHYQLLAGGKLYSFDLNPEKKITTIRTFNGKRWKNEITKIVYSFPVESKGVEILAPHPFVKTLSVVCSP